jgi:hypothetical protein
MQHHRSSSSVAKIKLPWQSVLGLDCVSAEILDKNQYGAIDFGGREECKL